MAQKKLFKELDLSNAFLFAAALEDEETCQLVLEVILGETIGPVKVKPERTILFNSDFRCVRLDIYASDALDVGYNLEMQNSNEGDLPKRSRYHQAEMDLSSLKPGQDFRDLKPCTVIFICAFDPFHKGLYRYIFEERCIEADLPLGDGTKRIFLNTKGKHEGQVPEVLVHFLKYVENSTDGFVAELSDTTIEKLHTKIAALKCSRGLEEAYMQLEEMFRKREKEGLEQGLEQGEQRMLELICHMVSAGKNDEIPKLKEDHEFLEAMFHKYQL